MKYIIKIVNIVYYTSKIQLMMKIHLLILDQHKQLNKIIIMTLNFKTYYEEGITN
jgi:hypothetical protein